MKKKKYIPDFSDIPTQRQSTRALTLEERQLNFNQVELGYTVEEAQAEARRCLSCRQCIGCALCMAECKERAIILKQKAEEVDIEVDSVILAPGFEAFNPHKKPEIGYNKFYNVITSIELERMLSTNGSFGGLVLRPWEGSIPRKIAFIQCVGSREEFIGANYCSSICCNQAIKQALQLQEKDGKAQIEIFIKDDIRPLGKGAEEYFQDAVQKPEIKVVKGEVTKLHEDNKAKDIIVEYTRDGKAEKETFDLVVLSVGLWAPSSARKIKELTGVKLNKYSFCSTDTLNPERTSKPGIFASGSFIEPMDIRDSIALASSVAAQTLSLLAQQGEFALKAGDNQESCLIIGGGPAGLKAAQTVANLGFQSILVEKNKELGGGLRNRYFAFAREELKEGFENLIQAVKESENIQIYDNAQVTNIQETNGLFQAEISRQDKKCSVDVDSVIVATGADEYVPKEYHYSENESVITQAELAQLLEKNEIAASNIVMIQCVGCRNAERSYCSRICCVEALENALKIKELNPESKVTILHKGLRVFGFEEDLLTDAQDKAIEFIIFLEEPELRIEDGLKIQLREEKGRKTMFLSPDLLALSNAVAPHRNNETLASMLKIPLSEQGFFHAADEILKPLQTSNPGIYLCGMALWPATLKECISQGSGAAIKACQRLKKLTNKK